MKALTFVGSASGGPTEVDGVPFPRSHEGHGGYTIDQISDFITTNNTIATYKPDVVLLEIGTNDVKVDGADTAAALMRLGNLVDKILASNAHLLLIVAQITPTETDATNVRVRAYNAGIPGLVRARADAGKHVATVDNYTPLASIPNFKTDYMYSDVHPNGAGYVVIGDGWYGGVAPLLH